MHLEVGYVIFLQTRWKIWKIKEGSGVESLSPFTFGDYSKTEKTLTPM